MINSLNETPEIQVAQANLLLERVVSLNTLMACPKKMEELQIVRRAGGKIFSIRGS